MFKKTFCLALFIASSFSTLSFADTQDTFIYKHGGAAAFQASKQSSAPKVTPSNTPSPIPPATAEAWMSRCTDAAKAYLVKKQGDARDQMTVAEGSPKLTEKQLVLVDIVSYGETYRFIMDASCSPVSVHKFGEYQQ